MARSETAQILIQIRGGMKAAAEAAAVADAVDDLGDDLDESARSALLAQRAMSVLSRELKQLGRASAISAAATSLNTLALRGMMLAVLGLAITAMPALIAALGAGTVALTAFAAGLVGIGLAAGVMALAAVQRFKATADVAGSVADRLQEQAKLLKGAFADSTASGATSVLAGLIPLLRGVRGLVRDLEPAFTTVGQAMGSSLRWLGESIGELGPELSDLLTSASGAFQPLARLLLMFVSLLARVGTVAMPYVIDGLNSVADLFAKWQGKVTDGRIEAAFDTVGQAIHAVGSFLGGIADTLGPVLGPAAADLADTLSGMGGTFGAAVGLILAGLVQISHGALPGIVALISSLTPAFQAIVDSGVLTTLGSAIGSVFGTAGKVISAVVTHLQSVGALKPLILAVVAAFVAWKLATIALNLAMAANPVGLIVIAIAALAAGVIYAYQRFEWFRNGVNTAWSILKSVFSWIGGHWRLLLILLGGPIGAAVVLIVNHFSSLRSAASSVVSWVIRAFGNMITFVSGLPGKVSGALSGMWEGLKTGAAAAVNWVIDRLNDLISAYNSVSGIAKVVGVDLTINKIGHVSDGSTAGGAGPGAPKAHPIQRRALGGPIFGGAPFTDRISALLTPGEHVWTRQEVTAAGGHGAVMGLRSAVLGGSPAAFALGGPVGSSAPRPAQFTTGGPVGPVRRPNATSSMRDLVSDMLPDVHVEIPLRVEGREMARVVDTVRLQDRGRQGE